MVNSACGSLVEGAFTNFRLFSCCSKNCVLSLSLFFGIFIRRLVFLNHLNVKQHKTIAVRISTRPLHAMNHSIDAVYIRAMLQIVSSHQYWVFIRAETIAEKSKLTEHSAKSMPKTMSTIIRFPILLVLYPVDRLGDIDKWFG